MRSISEIPIFPGAIKLTRWMEKKRLEREAEIQLLEETPWAEAQAAAAEKILRRNGQKP